MRQELWQFVQAYSILTGFVIINEKHCVSADPSNIMYDPTPSPQGVAPTLRDLSLLPVPNWYLLGLQLGISGDELDVIERNYPVDPKH